MYVKKHYVYVQSGVILSLLHYSCDSMRLLCIVWSVGAPAYKLAQMFAQKIKLTAPLPNTHNLENTSDLLRKLEHTPILPHFTLASLDISNLYTNIPVKETRKIIANNLTTNKVNSQAQQEL